MEIFTLSDVQKQHGKTVKAGIILLTVALVALGILNMISQGSSLLKTDGVRWTFSNGSVIAASIPQRVPGDVAGIEVGDRLVSINFHAVHFPQDVGKILRDYGIGDKPF